MQEFLYDGTHQELHGAVTEPEDSYGFDAATGRLVLSREEQWVTEPTASTLTAYRIDDDGIFRCRFRREPHKGSLRDKVRKRALKLQHGFGPVPARSGSQS